MKYQFWESYYVATSHVATDTIAYIFRISNLESIICTCELLLYLLDHQIIR